jgi:uncharacterized protein YkwD
MCYPSAGHQVHKISVPRKLYRSGCLFGICSLLAICALTILPCWADDAPARDQTDVLLSMLNDIRAKAGLTPLKTDGRVNDAAAMHLAQFVEKGEISDQFDGESSLLERLRMAQIPSGAAGEIMVRTKSLEQVPELLKSDQFKKALLNPAYSLVGFAQVQQGQELFIVANLVRPLQTLSPDEVENLLLDSLQQARNNAKLMAFKINPMRQLRSAACDMAKKDSLKTAPVNPYFGYVGSPSQNVRNFTFTTIDPGALPHNIQIAGDDPKINTASAGVCFAKSKTYPEGVYWVILVLYGSGAQK